MDTFFSNIADLIKYQYLVYEIYINHMTKVMTMSESWDTWVDLHFRLLLAYAAWDILGGNLSQKLKSEWKKLLSSFKKQGLQDHSLFGKIAWTCTLKSKESSFLGILHYILGNK